MNIIQYYNNYGKKSGYERAYIKPTIVLVHGIGLSYNCSNNHGRPAAYMSLLQAEFLGVSSLSPSWSKERSDDGLVPA